MKALVIGYGSIGRRHANILTSMNKFDDVVILSSQSDLNYSTIKTLEEIKEINPDYIVIASKTSLHLEQLTFLESNFQGKTILVEKPLFHMGNTLQVSRNEVYVGYNMRFNPLIKKIKDLCKDKELWSINVFCGSYLPDWRPNRDYSNTYSAKDDCGGGVTLDLSHEFDYIQWIAGKILPEYCVNTKLSDLKIDTDDFLMLYGKTSRGSKLSLCLNYFTRTPYRQIIIDGQEISIQANLIDNTLIVYEDNKPNLFSWPNLERNFSFIAQHNALTNQDFSEVCSFSEGMETMELIDMIKRDSYG